MSHPSVTRTTVLLQIEFFLQIGACGPYRNRAVQYSTVKTRNTHTQRKRRSRVQKFQGGATDRPRKCTVRDLRHYPDLIWTSERARHAVLATITHASKTSDALVREKEINIPSNPPIERSGTWRLERLPFRTARAKGGITSPVQTLHNCW